MSINEKEAEFMADLIKKDQQRIAIEAIKKIQSGNWDKDNPDPPKGEIAIKLWNDVNFRYGMEYGAIVALMGMFEITKDEL